MGKTEWTRKPLLMILLGVGIALMCAGLVLALSGFTIGGETVAPQENTPQYDTSRYSDSMVIYMADNYLASRGRYPVCEYVTDSSYALHKDVYYGDDGVCEVRYYCRLGEQEGTGNLQVTVYIDEAELFVEVTH